MGTLNRNTNTLQLVLFVAGDSPRSQRARLNLDSYLKQLEIDVNTNEIDVIKDPSKALEYGIFATPALMYTEDPDNSEIIYGDLSDTHRLQSFMNMLYTA